MEPSLNRQLTVTLLFGGNLSKDSKERIEQQLEELWGYTQEVAKEELKRQ